MEGRAVAPGAGTIVNALATERGSAFAIDVETVATVELTDDGTVSSEIADAPSADTTLIERTARLAIDRFGADAGMDVDSIGFRVRTESDVPIASGLKSSSAAANATVLATLDALGVTADVDPVDAARLGVEAARDAGVTVTGAFDDASASMLGGVTVTDNRSDELLSRETVDWEVCLYTPPERAYSVDVDADACDSIVSMAELSTELALDARYGEAMTVNGFAYCGALEYPTGPLIDALPQADGVSLSGTGPSYVAIGGPDALDSIETAWGERPGTVRRTKTRTDGATVV
ncbi:shikimate kinase [Halovivax gelatinilyticus]|uniref:shikimate kinase n=1 Tax=Halovivax gelatinilyticus TaxID=2961597 RepID=UPI0020CA3C14|nr:shikimate kinase [Halovivax gelatinilyticus]